MQEEIKTNLNSPKQLEKLYRDNKTLFKNSFDQIYSEISEHPTAQIWYERLHFKQQMISWGSNKELLFILAISFIAGIIAKIPQFTGLDEDFFYPRNISLVVLPMLAAYFVWKQNLAWNKILIVAALIVASSVYINILPPNETSDTLILACIHLPLFLWTVLGYTYTGDDFKKFGKRIDFLRFNGDLIVMTTVILIAGAILSAVTVGLFEMINIKIEEFYFSHVAIWGLAAAPIFGTYLVQQNPQLVKNVSPIIAKVFTPLVLVMLVVYLIAIIYTGKDPYNDREFLFIFNLLLIGVMAIILFSISESAQNEAGKIELLLLLGLSIVTIVVNGIALSAILFRIFEFGITPNRLAVLGSNVLILVNLLMVAYRLFKTLRDASEIENVEKSIAMFLPIYSVWTIIVTFLFPLIFAFK